MFETKFNIGDKVRNLSDREGIILSISDPTASVNYGGIVADTSLKYLTLVKAAAIPLWKKQVGTHAHSLPSVDAELLNPSVSKGSRIRIYCDMEHEEDARQLFDREGVVYPSDWRGTEGGKHGGLTRQRSLSAHVSIPRRNLSDGLVLGLEATHGAKASGDFIEFNGFDYILKLLVDGKPFGWRITASV